MPTVDFPAMRSMRMLSARKREAEVVAQTGDAAVLDTGFGLELEGRDHRAGIDLRDLSANVELAVLLLQHLGRDLEFVFVDGAVLVGPPQQRGRRKLVASRQLAASWSCRERAVGARRDGDRPCCGHFLRRALHSARSIADRLRLAQDGREVAKFGVEHPLDAALDRARICGRHWHVRVEWEARGCSLE